MSTASEAAQESDDAQVVVPLTTTTGSVNLNDLKANIIAVLNIPASLTTCPKVVDLCLAY